MDSYIRNLIETEKETEISINYGRDFPNLTKEEFKVISSWVQEDNLELELRSIIMKLKDNVGKKPHLENGRKVFVDVGN